MDFNERIATGAEKQAQPESMPKFTMAKIRLASHPDTSPRCLNRLSRHKSAKIIARVAEHSNTSIEVLQELAGHSNPEVRLAVCENSKTPTHVLLAMTTDENVDVRYCLAENHNVPLSILDALIDDENPYVAARANQTLNRLRQSGHPAFTWLPCLQHRHRKKDIG